MSFTVQDRRAPLRQRWEFALSNSMLSSAAVTLSLSCWVQMYLLDRSRSTLSVMFQM